MTSIFARLFMLIVLTLPLAAQHRSSAPLLKSALLPGWGERSLGATTRGNVLTGGEVALWAVTGLSWLAASHADADLRALAAEAAGVTGIDDKSDEFLDNVAGYESMTAYNDEKLRNRQPMELYSEDLGQDWEWASEEDRLTFKDYKLERYQWRQRISYGLGAIALNHLISVMDTHYLRRLDAQLSVSPDPVVNGNGLRLTLTF